MIDNRAEQVEKASLAGKSGLWCRGNAEPTFESLPRWRPSDYGPWLMMMIAPGNQIRAWTIMRCDTIFLMFSFENFQDDTAMVYII